MKPVKEMTHEEITSALPQLLDRLEKLEAVVEAAKYFLNEKELLLDEYYRVRNDEAEFAEFQKKERLWMDALAALEEGKG